MPKRKSAQTTSIDKSPLQLCCLIKGQGSVFTVPVATDKNTFDLKKLVYEEGKKTLGDVDVTSLVFLKVDISLPGLTGNTLQQLTATENDEGVQELIGWERVSNLWPAQPAYDKLHIFVIQPDESPLRPFKRYRFGDELPVTPPSKLHEEINPKYSPPAITRAEVEAKLASSLEGFEKYIQCLATGKLDGFFDSIRREDKDIDLGVHLHFDPILLLHALGKYPNQERIDEMFTGDTIHLFGVPGAGKTRLSLDGLCQNWGIYISCRPTKTPASGSHDFVKATEILQSMNTWDNGKSSEDILKNAQTADRTFTMLLCARIFILKRLVESLPPFTDATTARRRWVLAQVLPPCLDFGEPSDLFTIVLQSLRNASADTMYQIIRSMLQFVTTKRPGLFPKGPETKLFVVIDEVQVAADHLKEYFRSSTTKTNMRPILHEMYRFLLEYTTVVGGIILSGTGLSVQMVEEAVNSVSAKQVDVKRTQVISLPRQTIYTN